MSVQNQIDRIANAVESAHQKVAEMGGTTAQPYSVESLPEAIGTIPNFTDAAPAIHADQHRFCDTVTWDGDGTGRTVVTMEDDGAGLVVTAVLVSDKVPVMADFVNGVTYSYFEEEDGVANEVTLTIPSDAVLEVESGLILAGGCFIVAEDNFASTEYEVTFPKKGMYFQKIIDSSNVAYISSTTIHGYNLLDSTDPISPGMISAAPENHSSPEPKYGVADEERYGHARAYAQPYFADDEGMDLLDPNGNEFTFGVPSGYFLDMGFFFAFYGLFCVELTDYENQLTAMSEVIAANQTKIAQLEKDIAALKG